MHMSRKLLIALVLATPCLVVGQSAATRPATQTSAATPRDALRLLNSAMRTGDEGHIRALFLASTPAESRMIDADAAMAAALARLRAAAVKQFGAKHANIVTGDNEAASVDSIARIETADIDVRGDIATVSYHDEKNSQPFVLRKVDGSWRIPISELGKPLSPGALDQRLGDLATQRGVIEDIAVQILDGRLQTAEGARDAWRAQILKSATSQPTTRTTN